MSLYTWVTCNNIGFKLHAKLIYINIYSILYKGGFFFYHYAADFVSCCL